MRVSDKPNKEGRITYLFSPAGAKPCEQDIPLPPRRTGTGALLAMGHCAVVQFGDHLL